MSESGRFVEEVGRVLAGRALAVYDRKTDLPEWKRAAYIRILKGERPAPPPAPKVVDRPEDCPHIDPEAKTEAACRSCRKSQPKQVKAFHCSKYGEMTTLEEPAVGIPRCCKFCPENPVHLARMKRNNSILSGFKPTASPVQCGQCDGADLGKVHLVYHLLPVAENDVWLRNLSELATRSKLFTGRKIVSVMVPPSDSEPYLFSRRRDQTDHNKSYSLVPLEIVRKQLPPDCEVLTTPNDPGLWEAASWDKLWDRLFVGRCDPEDKVFYAHAKGVTRAWNLIRRWVEMMYSVCLDHPALVNESLSKHKITGAFRKVGMEFGDCPWHYSGTFFWSTVGEMRYGLDRTRLRQKWWGSEAWPGKAFDISESGVLLASAESSKLNLYDPDTWKWLEPLHNEWLSDHRNWTLHDSTGARRPLN